MNIFSRISVWSSLLFLLMFILQPKLILANTNPEVKLNGPTMGFTGKVLSFVADATDSDGNLIDVDILVARTDKSSSKSWCPQDKFISSDNGQWCRLNKITLTSPVAKYSLQASFNPPSVGEYYVVVNVKDAAGSRCGSNPWGNPSGWADCKAGGLKPVIIYASDQSPATPSTSVVFNPDNRLGYKAGEQVTLTFSGSGVKTIHTALVSGVNSEQEAKSSGKWESSYQGFKTGGTRTAIVPFYLEYFGEGPKGEKETVRKLQINSVPSESKVKVNNQVMADQIVALNLPGQTNQVQTFDIPVEIKKDDGSKSFQVIRFNYQPSVQVPLSPSPSPKIEVKIEDKPIAGLSGGVDLKLAGTEGVTSTHDVRVEVISPDGSTSFRVIKMEYKPESKTGAVACSSDKTCSNNQFCAEDIKNGKNSCVDKVKLSLPKLTPGSYAVFTDNLNKDTQGNPAKTRIEVELAADSLNKCPGNSKALRITKNNMAAYWAPGTSSMIRFCVGEENINGKTYLKSPGQYFYNWTKKGNAFPALTVITSGLLEYPQNNFDVYMGILNGGRDGGGSNNSNPGNIHYALVPASETIGFYPGSENWASWYTSWNDSGGNNWHTEVKSPQYGGKILTRYIETGYLSAIPVSEQTSANTYQKMRHMVIEDWEWGDNLPTYIRQIERRPQGGQFPDADMADKCWEKTPYNCDVADGVKAKLTSELVKKYEFSPTQKLNVSFIKEDGTLAKNIVLKGSGDLKFRITTDNGEPYFGFIQVRTNKDDSKKAVWTVKSMPVFVAGQDIILRPSAWVSSNPQGTAYTLQMRAQVSNENIDAGKILSDKNQPNVESIPWSDELQFIRDDNVGTEESQPSRQQSSGNKFDLNGDGVVNGVDVSKFSSEFNKPASQRSANIDLNGDGVMNILDYQLLKSQLSK